MSGNGSGTVAALLTSDRARVLMYGAAIYALYITQGVVFEQLFSHPFGEPGQPLQRWHYPETVLLCNIVGNILVALVMLWFVQPPPSTMPQKWYLAMAVPVFVASWLTMYAMSLVDYPTVSLFKSAKPLAVLGVAVIARRADVYNSKQKVMVVLVSLGLGLFFMAKEGVPRVVQPHWSGMSDAALGYCALLGALLLDGLAALAAVAIQCSASPPSPYHLQLYVNLWSFVTVFTSAVLSGRLYAAADFLSRFPSALWMLLKLATLSGVGQLFIFGTMMAFNPLVLSLVTTTRKFFTILLSSLVFAHEFHPLQWVAVVILFGGLLWRDVLDLTHSCVGERGGKRDADVLPMRGSSIVSAV